MMSRTRRMVMTMMETRITTNSLWSRDIDKKVEIWLRQRGGRQRYSAGNKNTTIQPSAHSTEDAEQITLRMTLARAPRCTDKIPSLYQRSDSVAIPCFAQAIVVKILCMPDL